MSWLPLCSVNLISLLSPISCVCTFKIQLQAGLQRIIQLAILFVFRAIIHKVIQIKCGHYDVGGSVPATNLTIFPFFAGPTLLPTLVKFLKVPIFLWLLYLLNLSSLIVSSIYCIDNISHDPFIIESFLSKFEEIDKELPLGLLFFLFLSSKNEVLFNFLFFSFLESSKKTVF